MPNDAQEPATHADWPMVLAWAEVQGLGNLQERLATKRWMHQEASQLLNVCLIGMAASLAFAATLFNAAGAPAAQPAAWGAVGLCAWLSGLSFALTSLCLLARPLPMLHHEAMPLAQPGYSLPALREVALTRLQERIEATRAIVERAAKTLNSLRLAVAASPAVFAIAAWKLQALAAWLAAVAT